jgi:hypothetical protein
MKAYRVEILVVDHDEIGPDQIKYCLERTKYTNWCMAPDVIEIQECDIGEWTDEHPLNQTATYKDEFRKLFAQEQLP